MKHRIEVRVKNKEKVLDGRVMKLPAIGFWVTE